MACFWQGIITSLTKEDKGKLDISSHHIPNLIEALKKHNTIDIEVLWQGNKLNKKQKDENFIHIKDYNTKSYNSGYLCGTCDPFLLLLCSILEINIKHHYLNNEIIYSCKSNKTYIFKSNRGHFTYKNKIINH